MHAGDVNGSPLLSSFLKWCCLGWKIFLGPRAYQVSSDSSHSAPITQASADNRPLNRPHSKSSHPRLLLPYFRSIRRAALLAFSKRGFCASVKGSSPVLIL